MGNLQILSLLFAFLHHPSSALNPPEPTCGGEFSDSQLDRYYGRDAYVEQAVPVCLEFASASEHP